MPLRRTSLVCTLMAAACALDASIAERAFALSGGHAVAPGAWPNVLGLDSGCTAVLLAPDLLVTAGHCAERATRAFAGDRFLLEDNAGELRADAGEARAIALRKCVAHPAAEAGSGFDLGYCLLEQPLRDVPVVAPAVGCVRASVGEGAIVTLVGFGLDRAGGGTAGTKRVVEAPFVDKGRELAIGADSAGTCRGDSGSPAFARIASQPDERGASWQLLAIMSSGMRGECGIGYYTDLARLVPWLEETSGRDVTPCSDALGRWRPEAQCREVQLDGAGAVTGGPAPLLATCGEPFVPQQPPRNEVAGCSVLGRPAHGTAALAAFALCLLRRRRRRD